LPERLLQPVPIATHAARKSTAHGIINDAARAYRDRIPADCYHDPYMPLPELRDEWGKMTFFGWQEGERLVGVMGYQPVQDVTLIRHAYVVTGSQRRGIGARLLEHMVSLTRTRWLLVGTWADAWSVGFYLKHGFALMPGKDDLLRRYWTVSARQMEASVVLGREVDDVERARWRAVAVDTWRSVL
jgi:GNAT superfamily N-acetyltransferase